MSKELEALQDLSKLIFIYGGVKQYKLIENALKRLEKIETTTHSVLREDISKKLKAIEIIKEKGCLQFCMFGVSLEDYNNSVDIANKDYGFERYKHYNQEEYDLLKEVLL